MLNQVLEQRIRFSRRDATRLGVASVVLVILLTVLLAADFLRPSVAVEEGRPAAQDIVAPGPISFVSDVQTEAERDRVRAAVDPQYDYSPDDAILVAAA